MGRREILVFVAAFAVVLLGGAALAQVGTFGSAPSGDAATLSAGASVETSEATETDRAPVAALAAAEPTVTTEAPSAAEDKSDEQEVDQDSGEKPQTTDAPKEEEPPAEEVDDTPPPLEILFPENEQHFEEDHIAFEGKTEPGARVFAGPYEADVDGEGNWRIVLILSPGGNKVTFKAKDAAGNASEASVKVYLDEEEVTKEFTAHQKWEVVDGYPAENKYYGTANPGTKIWVGSKYGDGSTTAGDNGEWLVRVKFPETPCNETFSVVVEAEGNHRREFQMKYVCATHEFSAHQKYGENESAWTKFYGTGIPGTTVWAVSEYGSAQTTVEGNGEWLLKLHFNDDLPANKEIGVVVEGEGGRAEFGFYWIVKDTVEVDFTAHQEYGSCGEPLPYDKFYGTAMPGATVWVESPYGSGTTTAGPDGHWHIRVDFPESPVGEPFTVVVESSDGGRAEFTFVRTAEG